MPKPVHDLVDKMLADESFYPKKSKEERESTAWAIAYSQFKKTEKKSYWIIDGKLIKTALDVKIHQAKSADKLGNFRLADSIDRSIRFAYHDEDDDEDWHAQSGEYWIDDQGSANYADNGVGDIGHQDLAEEKIISELGFDAQEAHGGRYTDYEVINKYTAEDILDQNAMSPHMHEYHNFLIDHGLSKEDYDLESYLRYLRHRNRPQENHEEYNKQTESLIAGLKDPRNYVIFNFGWIRVVKRGSTVILELEKLNQKTLNSISSAIEQITAYEENRDILKFTIEVFSPRHISLNDITLKDIESGEVQSKYLQGLREMLPPQVAEEYYKNFFGTVGHPYYRGKIGD
jgi:hypothetical protein